MAEFVAEGFSSNTVHSVSVLAVGAISAINANDLAAFLASMCGFVCSHCSYRALAFIKTGLAISLRLAEAYSFLLSC